MPRSGGASAGASRRLSRRLEDGSRRAPRHVGSDTLRELALVEGVVEALLAQQLRVVALLDDPARVHDHDLVGVADRRETVRDDEGGAAVTEARHRLLDEHRGARGDVAGRSVEAEDARIGKEPAGESDYD